MLGSLKNCGDINQKKKKKKEKKSIIGNLIILKF